MYRTQDICKYIFRPVQTGTFICQHLTFDTNKMSVTSIVDLSFCLHHKMEKTILYNRGLQATQAKF